MSARVEEFNVQPRGCTITGTEGDDRLEGGAGIDHAEGGGGGDRCVSDAADDTPGGC